MSEKVKCEDCGKELLKKDAVYDADAGEYICEEHLGENITGYCSIGCQRTGACDQSC